MRLNKYLSESGACSRREADTYIEEGRVTINGVPATLGTQVNEGDEVKLDGDIVGAARKKTRPVYIALNKPVGITCTTERHIEGNIIDFVDHPERIFPIGRLDKESEGLILLTNDGDIVNEVLRVEHNHEKEYVVAVDRPFGPDFVESMSRGVRLSDATTRPCQVEKLGANVFRIILKQGLNRQIRRMADAHGYTVTALQRVRIMHIKLGTLAVGRWRNLTEEEVAGLWVRGPAQGSSGGAQGRPGSGGGQGRPQDGRPQGGRPQGGRPQDGRPQDGRPQDGRPQGGRPGQGQGRPGQGQGRPQDGRPGQGQGRPQDGRPGQGQGRPAQGRPGQGHPGQGRPGQGRPGQGRPGQGRPGQGRPGQGHGGHGGHGGGGRRGSGGRGRG